MRKSAPAFALGALLASSSVYADQITFGPSTQAVTFTATAAGLAVSAPQLDFSGAAFDTTNAGLGTVTIAGLDLTTGPEIEGIFTANANSATFHYVASDGDMLTEKIHITSIQDNTEQPKFFFSGDAPSRISGDAAFLAAFSGADVGDWIQNSLGVTLTALKGSAASSVSTGEKIPTNSPVPEPATLGIFGVGLLALSWWHRRRSGI